MGKRGLRFPSVWILGVAVGAAAIVGLSPHLFGKALPPSSTTTPATSAPTLTTTAARAIKCTCATTSCSSAGACPDKDGDGLSDAWEKQHFIDMNCNGKNDAGDVELKDSSPDKKDIYIRYDYFQTSTHSHKPPQAALDQVTEAFKAHGIVLHWLAPTAALNGPGGANSEYQVVTLDAAASPSCAGSSFVTMQTLRHGALCSAGGGAYPCIEPGDLQPAYHYMVFGHDSTTPHDGSLTGACPTDPLCGARPTAGSTGVSDISGDDSIISLGAFVDASTPIGIEMWTATIMHELGHNLGLVHGSLADPTNTAQECLNFKPNYVSVMNYTYQSNAILPATAAGGTNLITCTGDASCGPPAIASGPCATAGACHCTDDLASFGGNVCYRVDYSGVTYAGLTEAALNEDAGVNGPTDNRDVILYWDTSGNQYFGPSNSGSSIDWNNDGALENPSMPTPDIDHNGNTSDAMLTSTDWDKLACPFQCSPAYGGGVAIGGGKLPAEWSYRLGRETHTLHPPLSIGVSVVLQAGKNSLQPKKSELLQVAVLATPEFDPSRIVKGSLRINGVEPAKTVSADVNRDKLGDLVLHVPTHLLRLKEHSTTIVVTGLLAAPTQMEGGKGGYKPDARRFFGTGSLVAKQ